MQSNNAVVVTGKGAVDTYLKAFGTYFSAAKTTDFSKSNAAAGWTNLGISGLDAKVGFSPHSKDNGLLDAVRGDIDKAKSSVFFSLAFLGQMTRGPVGPALGRAIKCKKVFTLGIADARVKEGNLGVTVLSADQKRRTVRSSALTGNVPAPFKTGLAGENGDKRGTQMHHKFVVLDFDTDNARVYLGSHNFLEPADSSNGENLLLIKDRTVATSYIIEALRMYDHYTFRSAQEDTKSKKNKVLELELPPKTAAGKLWWQ